MLSLYALRRDKQFPPGFEEVFHEDIFSRLYGGCMVWC
jgi:hypothetical protein